MVRFIRPVAALLAGALSLTPFAALATPAFAVQTGKDCVACHLPARELEGKAGLNPMGQAFLQCGFKFDCSTPAAQTPPPLSIPPPSSLPLAPGPAPMPLPPRPVNRAATFDDFCRNGDSFFTVHTGSTRPSVLRFVLKNNHHVTLQLPATATFASSCGAFPQAGAVFNFVKFD